MLKKSTFIIGVCWIFLFVMRVTAQEDGAVLQLDELIAEALENNPEIKAARNLWQASASRPAQVSALPDPMLSYSRFIESVETRVGPQEQVLTLSQRVPFPGKLSLEGKMATEEASAQRYNFEATRRDIVFKVKSAYYDLYWIDRSRDVLEEYDALLQDFTQVAETRYATGEGIQASVLKSHVEVSSIREKQLNFDKMRKSVAARINALLGRRQGDPVAGAATLDSVTTLPDQASLIERALSQRQELLAAKARLSQSQYRKSLAGKSYLPDFNLQANYIDVSEGVSTAPDAGKNAWSVMVGVNVPIWFGKNKAAVQEAEATISARRQSLENLENHVRAEIQDLYGRLTLTRETLNLYEQTLLPQAESSLQSVLASYRTGTLEFLDLLDAERMLLNLQLTHLKEQANYRRLLAELERVVAGDL